MASIDSQSNFEIFQHVLRKSKMRSSAGKAVRSPQSTGEPSYSASSQMESVSTYNSQEEKDLLPFLRQTIRWDRQLQRKVELTEVPDEHWAVWVSVEVKTKQRAWVRQQREFNESGVKIKDRLVLLEPSEILSKTLWDFEGTGIRLKQGGGVSFRQYSDSCSEDDYLRCPTKHREISLSHEHYRDLFFEVVEFGKIQPSDLSISANITLEVLGKFIDHVFTGARKTFEEANQGIGISYPHVWTLFQPGTIVYEKRLIPPFNESYEQCFQVRSAENIVSHSDGTNIFRLLLEEIVYTQGTGICPGTRIISASRHIREYDGLRDITPEDLGVVPLSVIPKERQREICTAITQRSREFLRPSAIPFSIWNYKGPVGLLNVTGMAGHDTLGDTKLSQTERAGQRYTHENVVIDLRSSTTYFDHRFPRWLHSFQDVDDAVQNTEPIQISDMGHSKEPDSEDGNFTDNSLSICRGYLSAYLVSSRVYAVNILVSELKPPVWEQQDHWGAAALSLPDESQWFTLLQAYFEEGGDMETNLGRHQTRGAGLVLVLQGSKILTRIIATNISAKLKRPLVSSSLVEGGKRLSEASKDALTWGGVLHVDHHGVSNNQRDAGELARHFSFYPSVVLVTCNDVTELGTACESEIDAVIACNTSSADPILEVWKRYLVTELPELTALISEQRLKDACRILAQLEPKESRMGKVLKTAKRIAIAERSVVSFGHIFAVIRSSLSLAKLEEAKDILAAGDEL